MTNKWHELTFYSFVTTVVVFFFAHDPLYATFFYLGIGVIHSISALREGSPFRMRFAMIPFWLFFMWVYLFALFRGWVD